MLFVDREEQVYQKQKLSPNKHGKVLVRHPVGDNEGDLNRSEESLRAGRGGNVDYGF